MSRLTLSFLDGARGHMPRLFVRSLERGGSGLSEQLLTFAFTDPYERQEAAEIWSSARHLPLQRLGSWGRLRDELALAWAIITGLGWTLGSEERALLASLEAQARRAE